jgi:hypothetical protein
VAAGRDGEADDRVFQKGLAELFAGERVSKADRSYRGNLGIAVLYQIQDRRRVRPTWSATLYHLRKVELGSRVDKCAGDFFESGSGSEKTCLLESSPTAFREAQLA